MPRLRKLRKKQKFQYHVKRRRLNQQRNKLPRINCDAIRNAWDEKKSIAHNLGTMGLLCDPNSEGNITKVATSHDSSKIESKSIQETRSDNSVGSGSTEVVGELETTAKEAFQKKKSIAHPLPPQMYKKLVQFLDKYGEDFEAMSRDHMNYLQETPSQLKAQITRLKKIPQQWTQYLKSRGELSANLPGVDMDLASSNQ